jgi:hypothetical protein
VLCSMLKTKLLLHVEDEAVSACHSHCPSRKCPPRQREMAWNQDDFALNRPTLGVSVHGPKRRCVIVPANGIIEVELPDSSEPNQTTDVKWGN